MEKSTDLKSISEFTLEQLFPKTLTDTTCVCIDKGSEVWLATEMCAHYTESVVDSLVIRENGKSLGQLVVMIC